MDKYAAEGNDIAGLLFEFRVFEREVIKGLQERFYRQYPYDFQRKMTDCLDVSAAKIRRITNKK